MIEKEQIFNIEKNELINLIEAMEATDDLRSCLDKIQVHIDILKLLSQAEYSQGNKSPIGTIKNEEEAAKKEEFPVRLKEGWGVDEKYYIGQFYRDLRGGRVGTKGDIYVPESCIRKMDLEHLDWIQATLIGKEQNKNLFDYKVLQKHEDYNDIIEKEVERRCVIEFALVRYYDEISKYYIEAAQSDDSNIKFKILLSETDLQKFRIKEGDIIEYVYWKEEILKGRVVWKHSQKTDIKEILSNTNSKSKIKKIENEKKILKKTLDGYSICMLGGSSRGLQKGIQTAVEERNGNFNFCTGDESRTTIESQIKKSDCVVIFTESIKHESMYLAKDICKRHCIPVSYTKNMGATQFIARVKKLLKQEKEQQTESIDNAVYINNSL